VRQLSWPSSVRGLTVVASAVPAILLVTLGWLLIFVALFLGRERRAYAERVYGRIIDLAAVLTRGSRPAQPQILRRD
jgi:hypothetical protein